MCPCVMVITPPLFIHLIIFIRGILTHDLNILNQEKFASNQGVALRPIIKQEKQAQENPSIPKPLVAPDIETSKPQEK